MTLDRMLDAVEDTETIMEAEGPRFRALIASDGWDSTPSVQADYDENQRLASGMYADLEADLVVAADPINDLWLMPWWRSLREARGDFLDHVAAWQERFATIGADPTRIRDRFSAISSTFRLACEAMRDAVPRVDFRRAGERVEAVCED